MAKTAQLTLDDIPASADSCEEVQTAVAAQASAQAAVQELEQRMADINTTLHGEEISGFDIAGNPVDNDQDGVRRLRSKEQERRRQKEEQIAAKVLAGQPLTLADVDDQRELDLRREYKEKSDLRRGYHTALQRAPQVIEKGRTEASKRYVHVVEAEYRKIIRQAADAFVAYRKAALAEEALRYRFWTSGWKVFPSLLHPMNLPHHVSTDPASPDMFQLWVREAVAHHGLDKSYLDKITARE